MSDEEREERDEFIHILLSEGVAYTSEIPRLRYLGLLLKDQLAAKDREIALLREYIHRTECWWEPSATRRIEIRAALGYDPSAPAASPMEGE